MEIIDSFPLSRSPFSDGPLWTDSTSGDSSTSGDEYENESYQNVTLSPSQQANGVFGKSDDVRDAILKSSVDVMSESEYSSSSRRNSFEIDDSDSHLSISIETRLSKDCFFPGETLYCRVDVTSSQIRSLQSLSLGDLKKPFSGSSLSNSGSLPTSPMSSNKSNRYSRVSSLDWLSVQICGYYAVEPNWIKLPTSHTKKMNELKHLATTSSVLASFKGDNKFLIFCTPATVLGCEIQMAPAGSTKSYIYQCNLPPDLPPSFKLCGIKCGYNVIVSSQKGSASLLSQPLVKTLNIPFRILTPICAIKKLSFISENISKSEYRPKSVELTANQVLESFEGWISLSQKDSDETYYNSKFDKSKMKTELIVNSIYEEHSKTVSMNISRGTNHLVKFSLNRTVFRLGDSLKGSFDFSEAQIPCLQLSVRLETEQTIESDFTSSVRMGRALRNVIFEHHELTHNTLHTSFQFSIPVEAIQEFTTEIVSLHWQLQFEFIVGAVRGDSNVDILPWNLSIRVIVPQHPPEGIYRPPKNNNVLLFG